MPWAGSIQVKLRILAQPARSPILTLAEPVASGPSAIQAEHLPEPSGSATDCKFLANPENPASPLDHADARSDGRPVGSLTKSRCHDLSTQSTPTKAVKIRRSVSHYAKSSGTELVTDLKAEFKVTLEQFEFLPLYKVQLQPPCRLTRCTLILLLNVAEASKVSTMV